MKIKELKGKRKKLSICYILKRNVVHELAQGEIDPIPGMDNTQGIYQTLWGPFNGPFPIEVS